MKKFLPTLACAAFLLAGIAQAQVVVRIGPPERPHEVVPPPPHEHPDWAWHEGYHRWDGHATSGSPEPTWNHPIPMPAGSPATGTITATATSG